MSGVVALVDQPIRRLRWEDAEVSRAASAKDVSGSGAV